MAVVSLFVLLSRPTHKKMLLLGVVSILFHFNLLMQWKPPPKALIGHVYKNSLLLTTENRIGMAHYDKKTEKIKQLAARF
jgi:hypothetical protein